jgi:hypothetical protein
VTVAADRHVYAVGGGGEVFRREGGPDQWRSLGRALVSGRRDLPVIAVDAAGQVFVACFGGRVNVLADGDWSGEQRLPASSGQSVGFVDLAASPDGGAVYAVWEEAASLRKPLEMNHPIVEATIWFARLDAAALAAQPRPAEAPIGPRRRPLPRSGSGRVSRPASSTVRRTRIPSAT